MKIIREPVIKKYILYNNTEYVHYIGLFDHICVTNS